MSGLASGLAAHIESLIEVKHAIGLPYTTSQRHLFAFDAMCSRDYPESGVLTREMAMAWAAARPGEHVNGQMRRITPVRQLAKHITGLGQIKYAIPAGIPGRQVRYRPHIFTHDQLRAIFDAADRIDHVDEAVEVDLDEGRDRDTEIRFDRPDRESGSPTLHLVEIAQCERCVYLVDTNPLELSRFLRLFYLFHQANESIEDRCSPNLNL